MGHLEQPWLAGGEGDWERIPLGSPGRLPTTVGELVRRRARAVPLGAPLEALGRPLSVHDAVVVVDDQERPHGVVTRRDVVERAMTQDRRLAARDVARPVPRLRHDAPLGRALDLIDRFGVIAVAVVDEDDHLAGLVGLPEIAAHADDEPWLRLWLERLSGRRTFWTRGPG